MKCYNYSNISYDAIKAVAHRGFQQIRKKLKMKPFSQTSTPYMILSLQLH